MSHLVLVFYFNWLFSFINLQASMARRTQAFPMCVGRYRGPTWCHPSRWSSAVCPLKIGSFRKISRILVFQSSNFSRAYVSFRKGKEWRICMGSYWKNTVPTWFRIFYLKIHARGCKIGLQGISCEVCCLPGMWLKRTLTQPSCGTPLTWWQGHRYLVAPFCWGVSFSRWHSLTYRYRTIEYQYIIRIIHSYIHE